MWLNAKYLGHNMKINVNNLLAISYLEDRKKVYGVGPGDIWYVLYEGEQPEKWYDMLLERLP